MFQFLVCDDGHDHKRGSVSVASTGKGVGNSEARLYLFLLREKYGFKRNINVRHVGLHVHGKALLLLAIWLGC